MQVTKTLFPTAKERVVEFDSDEGKKLIKDLNLNALPAYIFDENVAKAANFEKVSNAMDKSGVYYVINPAAVGIGKLLNPPAADDDPVKGDKNAKLTIIEFSDFQCPFCGKFFNEAYKKIDAEYIKTGKVKLVFRDFPLSFHENAHVAAQAAECADDQGKFWEMHDKIFENQHAITVSDLKKYAGDLKLDQQKFDSCVDTGKYKAEVDKDIDDGSKAGVSGTPSFFINGQSLSGALPFDEFKKIIDAELAK
ncbi:DsbA family protein [Candidatus Woesearchaeota archaeon]|nr:DsbA family protein [Candidatus Woesearchaeota archaeon]